MKHPTILLLIPALTTLATQFPSGGEPAFQLKEEAITLEYTASANEANIVIATEAEVALQHIEARDPRGRLILSLQAAGGAGLSLQGVVLESSEADLPTIRAQYEPGLYELSGRTLDGRLVVGSAVLSHALLRPPLVTYPLPGTTSVPTTDLVVSWIGDPQATGYQITLEQGDSDGLTATLAPGTTSFRVPDGLLTPGTQSFFEVGAIAPSGNVTFFEVEFTTR